MAYDSFRHVTFYGPVWDGLSFAGWWFSNWNGTDWSAPELGQIAVQPSGVPYDAPSYARMVFDSYKRRDVYFGGGAVPFLVATNVTALWDGHDWTLTATNAPLPSPRLRHAMAYDSTRHATVMLGGETLGNSSFQVVGNETWELLEFDTPLINEQPASQYRPAGATAFFNVNAMGSAGATLSYTWHHGLAILTDGRRYSGTASPTLRVTSISQADEGSYSVDVSSDCGTITSLPAFLTLNPGLQAFSGGGVITLVWGDPSAVLEQAPAITGPWSAVPGATSPFVISASGRAAFYRLRPNGP
jgi:hypothetical protein